MASGQQEPPSEVLPTSLQASSSPGKTERSDTLALGSCSALPLPPGAGTKFQPVAPEAV